MISDFAPHPCTNLYQLYLMEQHPGGMVYTGLRRI